MSPVKRNVCVQVRHKCTHKHTSNAESKAITSDLKYSEKIAINPKSITGCSTPMEQVAARTSTY